VRFVRRFTRGAVNGFMGLISSVALTVVSPSVWGSHIGQPKGSALFPYASPALFSSDLGSVIWICSPFWTTAKQPN
jgi:cation/acetate symporter